MIFNQSEQIIMIIVVIIIIYITISEYKKNKDQKEQFELNNIIDVDSVKNKINDTANKIAKIKIKITTE